MAMRWRQLAACLGMDTELWFAKGDSHPSKKARRVCAGCPVTRQCLTEAMRTEAAGYKPSDRYGIWGGLSPQQRNTLARAKASRR